ncbi:HAMP domain-containing methyl-accepting chemotaxis protein [Rhodovibrionaceae bacterium A322]
MSNLKISHKLYIGFAFMLLLLATAVAITIWEISAIKQNTDRVVSLRTPTAQASQRMTNNINASLAALRGWMLVENTAFKSQRAAVWQDIAAVRQEMDLLAASWTNPTNQENWAYFKSILDEFETAQQQVEDIARSEDETPATKILVTEAAPKAAIMLTHISKMIDLELAGQGGSGGDRVQILGMMADTRGSLGVGLANIRAYLLTGDEKFARAFENLWEKNDKRFADLSAAAAHLSEDQQAALEVFTANRKAFASLPPKMFAIRASDQWNRAQYLLMTEAAPRAGQLLTILTGELQPDGTRIGGMVENQKALLQQDVDASAAKTTELLTLEWAVLAIGLISGVCIAFFAARSVTRPVIGMTKAMNHLAEGDLQTEIPAMDRRDEIGEMAKALQVFKEAMVKARELEAQQARAREAQQKRAKRIESRAADFDQLMVQSLGTISQSSSDMQSSSETVSVLAEETSSQSVAVAAAAEQASANVRTVASATEELSASISEINQQVVRSTSVASEAVGEIHQATDKVKSLAEAANKIDEVVVLITDIAEQTNLLALNATIEAARAGDAGKGFAVVASEVKNLAGQTAKATEEISSQIHDIQSATQETVGAIDGIGQIVGSVSEISTTIAAAIEQQRSATEEISRNVEQAASGTQEVTVNISEVMKAAGETGQSSNQGLKTARTLAQQAEDLKQEVETFLGDIKAA